MTARRNKAQANTESTSLPPPLIQEITARNILSFGPDSAPIPLRRLNVLIGPNASGKSNLIEILRLLSASHSSLNAVTRKGGGALEWVYMKDQGAVAQVQAVITNPGASSGVRHTLEFRGTAHGLVMEDERLEQSTPAEGESEPHYFYKYQHGHPMVSVKRDTRSLPPETVSQVESILSQLKDPAAYPEIGLVAAQYERMMFYTDWQFGRGTPLRSPQPADERNDKLYESFANLGLVLNRLRLSAIAKASMMSSLKDLYRDFTDFDVSVFANNVQVVVTEGDVTFPATRLSDGTLRYLCLLAILNDPNPPPLVCIEEPEIGLHPDAIVSLARIIQEASMRMQLVVTTHSDVLVDALSDDPECVLVCEKADTGTRVSRLVHVELKDWLSQDGLGELWVRGELGGNRW